uniref:Ig-like domain-containing protein n=1 Tax=Callorhinchus milii TaxID=7868 RepID=A0A4W3JJ40_CALMI
HISVYIALYPKDCPSTEKPMKRLVAAELGERITVTCQYSKKLSDYSKFFCKVISNNECTRIADSNGAVNEPYKRRVSITHKGKSQVISIISAKEEDAGEYWCGAASGNEVEFTQVKILQISHGKNQEHVVQDYNKNVLKVSIVSLRNEYQVRALRAPGLYPIFGQLIFPPFISHSLGDDEGLVIMNYHLCCCIYFDVSRRINRLIVH